MMWKFLVTVMFAGSVLAATSEWSKANNLYQHTEYQQSLVVLQGSGA